MTSFEDGARVRPVFLPPRDQVTAQQMNILLNAARVLYSCAQEPDEPATSGPADGGARLAAQMSFVRVCDRIDHLLAEDSRWTMKEQMTLENDMGAMLKAQTRTAEAHQQSLVMTQLPQFRLHPLLVKLSSDYWVAYLGDIEDKEDSIVAIGTFPQDAMNNFDKVYLGQASDRLHQDLFDQLLARMNRTRTGIKNEIQVDTGTGRGTSGTAEGGNEPEGGGDDVGPDGESD